MNIPTDPTKDVLRFAVLAAAGIVLGFGLVSLYAAAATWTSLPSNPVVFLYFFAVLVVLPLSALWAFVLAWRNKQLTFAAVLAAIPAAILLLRFLLIDGL